MNIPRLIKQTRLSLKESQEEFSKRFNVSHAAVSDWEHGKSEAPYKVLDFILGDKNVPSLKRIPCERCEGKGFIIAQII